MNKEIFTKFIDKLIEDTKSEKIQWNKANKNRFATSDLREAFISKDFYYTEIADTGEVRISRESKEGFIDKLVFSIIPSNEEAEDEYMIITPFSDNNYSGVLRLYNLVNSIYKKATSKNDLEKAITAYINRPN